MTVNIILILNDEFISIVFRLISVDLNDFSTYFYTIYFVFTSIQRKIFYVN